MHSQHKNPQFMEEARGDIILEVEEEVFPEEDVETVPRISLVEDRIKTLVNQVVIGYISQIFNVIIARNLVIMHMNARRSSMTKEGKSKTSRGQCCWNMHP